MNFQFLPSWLAGKGYVYLPADIDVIESFIEICEKYGLPVYDQLTTWIMERKPANGALCYYSDGMVHAKHDARGYEFYKDIQLFNDIPEDNMINIDFLDLLKEETHVL